MLVVQESITVVRSFADVIMTVGNNKALLKAVSNACLVATLGSAGKINTNGLRGA